MRRCRVLCGIVLVAGLAGVMASSASVWASSPAGLSGAAPPGWLQLHYGPARTGYQPNETKIGTGNVRKLSQARIYPTNGSPSAPLVANGILYVATN